MQVSIDEKKKTVTIVLPLQTPKPSKSGKTMSLASTNGNKESSEMYKGKPVTVGCNVYFYE